MTDLIVRPGLLLPLRAIFFNTLQHRTTLPSFILTNVASDSAVHGRE